MIIINLTGGLGNQMFQYAAGRALSLKLKRSLKLHFTNALFNTQRKYELDVFNIQANQVTDANLKKIGAFKNTILNRLVYLIEQRFNVKLQKNVFTEKLGNGFDTGFSNIVDNSYIQGYFANEKYFTDIEATLRKDLTFKNKLDNKNLHWAEIIRHVESVSLHVRRSDYITNKTGPKFIGLNYYIDAIKKIEEKIKNPVFFVFSDDLSWTKQNLEFKHKAYFIDNNQGNDSYKDMLLMSVCKHNIIANSSFSWWGGWLNTNRNKIIIKP